MDIESISENDIIRTEHSEELMSAAWKLTQIIKKNNKKMYQIYVLEHHLEYVRLCGKVILQLYQQLLKILTSNSLSFSNDVLQLDYITDESVHDLCIYVIFHSNSIYDERHKLYSKYISSECPLQDIIEDILSDNESLPIYKYYTDPIRKVEKISR